MFSISAGMPALVSVVGLVAVVFTAVPANATLVVAALSTGLRLWAFPARRPVLSGLAVEA